jgi:hypothetical protein
VALVNTKRDGLNNLADHQMEMIKSRMTALAVTDAV